MAEEQKKLPSCDILEVTATGKSGMVYFITRHLVSGARTLFVKTDTGVKKVATGRSPLQLYDKVI